MKTKTTRTNSGQVLISAAMLSFLLVVLMVALLTVGIHVATWGAYKESTATVAECAAEVRSKMRWYHGMVRPDNGPKTAEGSIDRHATALANTLGATLGLPPAQITFTELKAGEQVLTTAHCKFSNLNFPGTAVPTACSIEEEGVSAAHSAGPMGLVNIEVPLPSDKPGSPPEFRGVQCPVFFTYTTGGLPSQGTFAVIRDGGGGASNSAFNLELGMYLSAITSPGTASPTQFFRQNGGNTVFSHVPYEQGQSHGFLHDTTSFPLVQ